MPGSVAMIIITVQSPVKYAGVGLGNVESTDFEFRLVVSAPSAVLFSSIF